MVQGAAGQCQWTGGVIAKKKGRCFPANPPASSRTRAGMAVPSSRHPTPLTPANTTAQVLFPAGPEVGFPRRA